MIYILIGAPGQGKTYSATALSIKALKKRKQVFTNYPIITPDRYSTEMWEKEFASSKLIQDSMIVIDEAWKDFNSKDWKEITPEEHSFFAECRHWNNDIYLISQTTARVATLAKEIAQIVLVKKKTFLFFWIIGFKLEYYETLEDVSRRHLSKEPLYYRHEWIWFRKYICRSYDTHYNARSKLEKFKGKTWLEIFTESVPGSTQPRQKLNLRLSCAGLLSRRLFDRSKLQETYRLYRDDLVKDFSWLFRQVKQIMKRLKWEVRHRIVIPVFRV